MALANRVAELAEAQPITRTAGAIRPRDAHVTSHDTGGLTARDFRLANAIDA